MKFTRAFTLMALAGLAGGVQATDGYFSHGYGMKAKGMGGAATATASDAMGGANNPASMAFVGDRLDLGVDLFSPRRESSRSGSTGGGLPVNVNGGGFAPGPFPPVNNTTDFLFPIPALDGSSKSDSNIFAIPEFGYNKMINSNLALGVSVYGNGGMNSNYKPLPNTGLIGSACNQDGVTNVNLLCGPGRLGVDLMQLVVAPTVAYKINPNHSIGISPLIGYERFKAEGLQAFGLISQDFGTGQNNVSNRGYDDAFGFGVRVGYYGRLSPTFSIGAAYASKMNFDEYSKYKGLFAEKGDFDIPENYNLGLAWQATPQILVALDYQRINYGGVNSINNPSTNFFNCVGLTGVDPSVNPTNPFCMGGNSGPGFGWRDIDIWKLGAEYKYNQQLTLRAGYNHTDQPIPSRDVEFNIIAPGVIQDHVTLGLTYTLASGDELTVAYMHGFENSVTGPSFFFGGTDTIKMYQNSLGVTYSWKM